MGKEISETLEEGEKARSLQSPNRTETWSRSQQKRELAMSGPRFEHTIFELQVGLPFQWSGGNETGKEEVEGWNGSFECRKTDDKSANDEQSPIQSIGRAVLGWRGITHAQR